MKGLELTFSAVLVGLFVIGIYALLNFMFIGKIADIHTIVVESESEVHVINLGENLLSSNLTYSDGNLIYRAMFDRSKLYAYLGNGLIPKNLDIWYPDAIAIVGIRDLETGEKWSAILIPKKVKNTAMDEVIDCLLNTIKIDITMLFRVYPQFPWFPTILWEWPDLDKCRIEFTTQLKPSVRGFPITIRVAENEIHSGVMIIALTELI
jgi:hypothetical protein